MENIKINIEEYPEYLGDIYYSLLTFVEKYVNQNFDPMESLTSEQSDYAKAKIIGKEAIKELLDHFTQYDEIILNTTRECVRISGLTYEEQLRLLEDCKIYIMESLEGLKKQKDKAL